MRSFAAVLSSLFVVCTARPEPPSSFGGYPASGLDSYAAPIGGGPGPNFGSQPVYGPPSQPPAAPVVHKHVYVHIPPPEAPVYRPKKVYQQPAPQKHYKIVFIKAPTPPPPTVPDLPPIAPPDEQKTLIYVLVKKPEEQPEIRIPTPAPTKPSKPEVYFIRYKTQKQETGYPDSGVPQNAYPGGSSAGVSGPASAPSAPAAPSAPSGQYGVPSSGGAGGY